MKKIFFSILILCYLLINWQFSFAQTHPAKTKSEEKPVIIRDRFMFDFYHTFWQDTPTNISTKKFNPGFTISGMWDFLLPNKSPISFGLGIGFSYYTQFSNAVLKSDESRIMDYDEISSTIKYSINKVTYNNINIPFEIRYRHSSGFKISAGMRLGLTTGISYRYKGLDPNGSEKQMNYKSFEIYNKEKFNYDVYLRTGWKVVGVYFCYQVTKLFENSKGPQMYPITAGITVNFF